MTVRVSDAVTKFPIPDVCVQIGTSACPVEALRTNELGIWIVDIPNEARRTQWILTFTADGYEPVEQTVVTRLQDLAVEIRMQSLTGPRAGTSGAVLNIIALEPPPVPPGTDRFLFRIIDSRTGSPLSNVCATDAGVACVTTDPHTSESGLYWLDIRAPAPSNWSFRFSKDGYVSVTINRTYRARMGTVVTTVDMRRR